VLNFWAIETGCHLNERYDVIIQGGGLTGLALAAALGDAGVAVLLVEERPMPAMTDARFDGRVTAIARGSKQALASIGAWDAMGRGRASPFSRSRWARRTRP
jgi:2-polyprenyl-6-methoxyphenol hydroxylase-like FAD-dependent oxidoreductase